MGYPENPSTIIVKNKFYPKGLKEIDIWNYYQSYKGKILRNIIGRDVALVIMVDINKTVIKRKHLGKYIRLMNDNYDKIITGRTIALYSIMRAYEDIVIIDLDAPTFNQSRDMVNNLYTPMLEFSGVKSLIIRFTGKTGFHVICEFARKMRINYLRDNLYQYLMDKGFNREYTIGHKRQGTIPNIDISPNKINGAFITPDSLSTIGLRCMDIQYNQLNTFDPHRAKIKVE